MCHSLAALEETSVKCFSIVQCLILSRIAVAYHVTDLEIQVILNIITAYNDPFNIDWFLL